MIFRRGVILGCVTLGLTLATIGVSYLTDDVGATLLAGGASWGIWAGVYAWLTKPRMLP